MRFCNSNDFTVINDENNDKCLLCNSKGFDVILFYSTQCQYCKRFVEVFKDAASRTANCEFSLVNLDNCKDIISKSKSTTTEIEFVPTTIFYAEGKPYMSYGGPLETDKFLEFISQVSRHYINTKQENKKSSGMNNSGMNNSGMNHSGMKQSGMKQNGLPDGACNLKDKECQIRSRRQMTCYLTLEEAYKTA